MDGKTIVYTNMNRSLIKKGGRKAARISEDALLQKVISMQKKYEPYGQTMDPDGDSELDMIYVEELEDNAQISKDLSKIVFCTENCIANPEDWDEESLIGLHTLSNGLTFLGMAVGGDWEKPFFLIIYWNGDTLRAYIPSYGNAFNPDFRTAFGSEGTNKNVKNQDIWKRAPYHNCEQHDATDIFLKSSLPDFGQNEGVEVNINWEAVEEDIINRIEVI